MPLTFPVKMTSDVDALLHTDWLPGLATSGVGSTVIMKFSGVPIQPFAVGVTVNCAVVITLPVFTAVNAATFPVPEEARPIVLLLLVHL